MIEQKGEFQMENMFSQMTNDSTLRTHETLPKVPNEEALSDLIEPMNMVRSRVRDEELEFFDPIGFERAINDGFFLIEKPKEFDLSAADKFVQTFYDLENSDRDYKSLKVPGDYQGYFDRPYDQWENFYIERANWALLSPDVAKVGRDLSNLGIIILKAVLRHLRVSEDVWNEVTGGLTDDLGHRMLAFNHYRSAKQRRGCKMHRDSGWVTILRSWEPGLVCLSGKDLKSINPEPGHLIVNFGSSIELLTAQLSTPVKANVHGVAQTIRGPDEQNRHSYTVFLDSRLDGSIYQIRDERPVKLQSVAEFAVQEVSRTYDDFDDVL